MEKHLEHQEHLLSEVHREVFDELSKLQVEQKFMERQAQSLIENLLRKYSYSDHITKEIKGIVESNDQDLLLQEEHLKHIKQEHLDEVQSTLSSTFKNTEDFAFDKLNNN